LEDVFSEAISAWEKCGSENYVDRLLEYYTKLYLQDDILTKVDRASMAVSLEVRCPFLDIELVDFVRRIPFSKKLRRGQTKYLLKQALRGILPDETLGRSKRGFGIPIGRGFQQRALSVHGTSTTSLGLNEQFIVAKRAAHERGRSDERAFLWNQWVLEQWFDSSAHTVRTSAVA